MNFLKETKSKLREHGKNISDIDWIGSRDGEFVISWDKFKEIADVAYSDGYGRQEVVSDIVIVGNNWWLERLEYDGMERWIFETLPLKADKPETFDSVLPDHSWSSISEMISDRVYESFKH